MFVMSESLNTEYYMSAVELFSAKSGERKFVKTFFFFFFKCNRNRIESFLNFYEHYMFLLTLQF